MNYSDLDFKYNTFSFTEKGKSKYFSGNFWIVFNWYASTSSSFKMSSKRSWIKPSWTSSPDGWEKNSWALGGLIGFQSLSNMLKNFFFHHYCIKIFFVQNQNFWQNSEFLVSISGDVNNEMMWLVWVFCKNLLEFRFLVRQLCNLHVNPRINRSGLCPAWFLGDDHGFLIKVFWSWFTDHESWFMMFNNLSL